MQEFSSGRYPGFVETNDVLITGVRGFVRLLCFDRLMELLAIRLGSQKT